MIYTCDEKNIYIYIIDSSIFFYRDFFFILYYYSCTYRRTHVFTRGRYVRML